MPIAAMIARRVGARIWIGRCIRIGNRACFDINVNELRIPRTNNQAEDIRAITAAIQRQFEIWIRENPENSSGQTGAGPEQLTCRAKQAVLHVKA
jgi:KDO2-lipid IV(A) lauroyltransferase